MSDSRREERATVAIEKAARSLHEALDDVYDQAFGLPTAAIEIVNEVLKPVGVKLVKRR